MCIALHCDREPNRNFCNRHYYRLDEESRTAVAFVVADARDYRISETDAAEALRTIAEEFYSVKREPQHPPIRAFTCPKCGQQCYRVAVDGGGHRDLELNDGGGYVVIAGYAYMDLLGDRLSAYAEFSRHNCDEEWGIHTWIVRDEQPPVPSPSTHCPTATPNGSSSSA